MAGGMLLYSMMCISACNHAISEVCICRCNVVFVYAIFYVVPILCYGICSFSDADLYVKLLYACNKLHCGTGK
jgi:hypothetical protein